MVEKELLVFYGYVFLFVVSSFFVFYAFKLDKETKIKVLLMSLFTNFISVWGLMYLLIFDEDFPWTIL